MVSKTNEKSLKRFFLALSIISVCLVIVVIGQDWKIRELEKETELMQFEQSEYFCHIGYLCHIKDSTITITKEFDDYALFLKEEQEINDNNFYQSCTIRYSNGCWENKK